MSIVNSGFKKDKSMEKNRRQSGLGVSLVSTTIVRRAVVIDDAPAAVAAPAREEEGKYGDTVPATPALAACAELHNERRRLLTLLDHAAPAVDASECDRSSGGAVKTATTRTAERFHMKLALFDEEQKTAIKGKQEKQAEKKRLSHSMVSVVDTPQHQTPAPAASGTPTKREAKKERVDELLCATLEQRK
jgi:hypothetical protein